MTELHQSDELLREALRFLVAEGLPLEVFEVVHGQRYEIEGQEVHADAIICSAYLLGMTEAARPPLH